MSVFLLLIWHFHVLYLAILTLTRVSFIKAVTFQSSASLLFTNFSFLAHLKFVFAFLNRELYQFYVFQLDFKVFLALLV